MHSFLPQLLLLTVCLVSKFVIFLIDNYMFSLQRKQTGVSTALEKMDIHTSESNSIDGNSTMEFYYFVSNLQL